MFVKTMKMKKSVLIAAVILIAALIVVTVALCIAKLTGGKTYRVKTEQQRQALISELGWETSEKPSGRKTVTIPEDFDEVYSSYNDLQKQQGFDLEKYKGKKVEIFSYPVYNLEGHEDCMTLTLISCDGTLIGGDVCCTELDGFMQGLKRA
jgi:hypothetical protein